VKGILRSLAFFAISLAVGESVRRLLMSRVGVGAASRLGRPDLATFDGANAASREAKKAVGFVRTLTSGKPALVMPSPTVGSSGWVGIAGDASDMLLAAGALLKAVSEFAREDAKLRHKVRASNEIV
jgi:hypothetical protein